MLRCRQRVPPLSSRGALPAPERGAGRGRGAAPFPLRSRGWSPRGAPAQGERGQLGPHPSSERRRELRPPFPGRGAPGAGRGCGRSLGPRRSPPSAVCSGGRCSCPGYRGISNSSARGWCLGCQDSKRPQKRFLYGLCIPAIRRGAGSKAFPVWREE